MDSWPACWVASDAKQILPTEALSGSDAVFLATHVPLRDLEVVKSESPLPDATDEALFESLRSGGGHVFCVVGGEPGAGKSHLIRWLGVKWKQHLRAGDRVVMIPRADGSLHGTLRALRDELPEEFRTYFAGLKSSEDVAEGGKRRNFQAKLANAMMADHFVTDLDDTDWCVRNGLASIFKHELVQDEWEAPKRILRIVGGQGLDEGDARLSAVAEFGVEDVLDLVVLQKRLRQLPRKPRLFLRKLEKEATFLKDLPPEDRATEQVRRTLRIKVPDTLSLIDALNGRLNHAIQELIGMTSDDLARMFRDLREKIGAEGRLILLLEDITNFQGVDDKLIDVLVERSDTSTRSCCDLISIVGITPHYHAKYASNYEQRFTHHVKLGEDEEGQYRTSRALSDPAKLTRFVATYLRAVRAGVDSIEAATDGRVVNKCDECGLRPECHPAFGEDNGVGLFPFTRSALHRIYNELRDPPPVRMTLQTPRGVIHNILNPTLRAPTALEQGTYPGPEIETLYLPTEQRDLLGALENHVDSRTPSRDRQRMRRLLAWWGQRNSTATDQDESGSLRFAGVSKPVFGAFGLPWIGGAQAPAHKTEVPQPQTQTHSKVAGPSTESIAPDPIPTPVRPTNGLAKLKKGGGSKSRNWAGLSQRRLQERRAEIRRWSDGEPLIDSDFWHVVLGRLMLSMRWTRICVSPYFRAKLFSTSRIVLEGTRKSRGNSFVLPRARWLSDGLAALLVLRSQDPQEELDFHRYRTTRALRRLETVAIQHVQGMMPRAADGSRWRPMAGLAQAAVIHAWLRGDVAPTADDSAHWAALFEIPSVPTSAPESRVQGWRDLLSTGQGLRRSVADEFGSLVNTPPDRPSPLSWADPSDAIRGIRALREALTPLAPPAEKEIKSVDVALLTVVRRVLQKSKGLPRIVTDETSRLERRIQSIDVIAEGLALRSFLDRTEVATTGVVTASPSAPLGKVTVWNEAYSTLVADCDAIDDLRAVMGDGEDAEGAERLAWCAAAPAKDIADAERTATAAEAVVTSLTSHIAALGAAGSTPLSGIQTAGAQLRDSSGNLMKALQ